MIISYHITDFAEKGTWKAVCALKAHAAVSDATSMHTPWSALQGGSVIYAIYLISLEQCSMQQKH